MNSYLQVKLNYVTHSLVNETCVGKRVIFCRLHRPVVGFVDLHDVAISSAILQFEIWVQVREI